MIYEQNATMFSMQWVPGITGSMKWTLARRAQGWQVLLQEGAFAEPAKRRCDVTVSSVELRVQRVVEEKVGGRGEKQTPLVLP